MQGGADNGQAHPTSGKDTATQSQRVCAAVAEAESKARLLEVAGCTQSTEPYMLDVVRRACEQAEVGARIPLAPNGPIGDRAWGTVAERPTDVVLYPPTIFEASDRNWVRNAWQKHMFRKKEDGKLVASPAELREA